MHNNGLVCLAIILWMTPNSFDLKDFCKLIQTHGSTVSEDKKIKIKEKRREKR